MVEPIVPRNLVARFVTVAEMGTPHDLHGRLSLLKGLRGVEREIGQFVSLYELAVAKDMPDGLVVFEGGAARKARTSRWTFDNDREVAMRVLDAISVDARSGELIEVSQQTCVDALVATARLTWRIGALTSLGLVPRDLGRKEPGRLRVVLF